MPINPAFSDLVLSQLEGVPNNNLTILPLEINKIRGTPIIVSFSEEDNSLNIFFNKFLIFSSSLASICNMPLLYISLVNLAFNSFQISATQDKFQKCVCQPSLPYYIGSMKNLKLSVLLFKRPLISLSYLSFSGNFKFVFSSVKKFISLSKFLHTLQLLLPIIAIKLSFSLREFKNIKELPTDEQALAIKNGTVNAIKTKKLRLNETNPWLFLILFIIFFCIAHII